MKRMAISATVLLAVFLLGFWSGRTELFVQLEEPPRLIAKLPPPMPPALRRELLLSGTMEFLQQELQKAREEAAVEKTSESRRRVENLEQKLSDAKGATRLEKENPRVK